MARDRGSLHERSRASEAYSAEQKRAAVDHYLEHGRCNAYTRRELGYPKSYQKLADWIEELAPGERRTTEPRTFTPEQKQRAVTALVGRAGSAREIAGEAGSSRCTLYRWKRELLGEGPDMTEAKHDAPAQGAGDGDGKVVRATQADIDALEARKGELVEELRRLGLRRDVMEDALELLGKGAGAARQTSSRTGRRRCSLSPRGRSGGSRSSSAPSAWPARATSTSSRR